MSTQTCSQIWGGTLAGYEGRDDDGWKQESNRHVARSCDRTEWEFIFKTPQLSVSG